MRLRVSVTIMPAVQLTPDQARAKERILDFVREGVGALSLTGPAGSGKTTVLGEILSEIRGIRPVMLSAMTGKAALRLYDVAGVPATTLHKVLYHLPDDETQDVKFDKVRTPERGQVGGLLVVDESSMITPAIWDALTQWVFAGVCVLLVGDSFQLPPVMDDDESPGGYSVFAHVPGPALETVMRNGDEVLAAATTIRNEWRIPHVESGAYRVVTRARHAQVAAAVAGGASAITWKNATRMKTCAAVRAMKGLAGGPKPGEPLLICKNGRQVLNGQVEVLASIESAGRLGPVQTHELYFEGMPDPVIATLDGRREWMDGGTKYLETDEWKAYVRARRERKVSAPIPVTWGYVLTAHKAQGSEFDRVAVFLDDVNAGHFCRPSVLSDGREVPFWTRWLYTAVTRAKSECVLYLGSGWD